MTTADSHDAMSADGLVRTFDALDQPVFVYQPMFDGERIDDLEIIRINDAARTRPLSQHLRVGDLASLAFVEPELAIDAADESWRAGSAPPYSIERRGLLGHDLITVRFEVSTFRIGELIAQTVVDRTLRDPSEVSDDRYRSVLEGLAEGVALLSLGHHNDGRPFIELVYENPASIELGPLALPEELAIVERVHLGRRSEFHEVEHRQRDGLRSLRVGYHPSRDGVTRVVVDQTAERALLRMAERQSDRQREVLDHVMEAVGIWFPLRDEAGVITDLRIDWRNTAAVRLGGHRIQPGQTLSAVLTDEVMFRRLVATATHVMDTGEAVEHRYDVAPTDDVPIESSSGRLRIFRALDKLVVAILDDTELARATQALSTSEARFRTTLDGVSDTVGTWTPVRDEHGRIVDFALGYANRAFAELIPVGAKLGSIRAEHDLVVEARRALEQPGPHTVITRIHDAAGPRTWRLTAVAIGDEVVSTGVELTELVRRTDELAWLAGHDPVSRLRNRNGLLDALQDVLSEERRTLALLWVEVAELDMIRHTFGFATADRVVEILAERLAALADDAGAAAARPEDGAFALVLPLDDTATAVIRRATSIIESLARPVDVDGLSLLVGPHGGIAIAPLNGHDPSVLTKRAKTAASEARRTGSTLIRWRQEVGADQRVRAALLGEFERALRMGQVMMEYQPKFCARTGAFAGAEALARWRHPDRGLIPPSLFVPAIEATALIRPFTRWAIETALSDLQHVLEVVPASRVSVNLPVALIADAGFTDLVVDTFVRTGLHPRQLQVEVTERGIDARVDELTSGLAMLNELGVSIALDDFGAGQSSLAFLRHLPLDEVKIDQVFSTNLHRDPVNRAVVAGCVGIARAVGLTVCAEGVETAEDADAARALDCDLLQGSLLGRPMPIDQLTEQLRAAATHTGASD